MNDKGTHEKTIDEIKAAIEAYREAGKRGIIGILAWYLHVPEEQLYRVAGEADKAEYDAAVAVHGGCER